MPRRTHPRARHRHDRGHIRFHRDRVVKKRGRQYRQHNPTFRIVFEYVSGTNRWLLDRWNGPWGYLEDEQAWFGCRRARCGMCGYEQEEDQQRRRREDRAWRRDWDIL